MTFQEPKEVSIEHVRVGDEGWALYVRTDGVTRAQIGPFRHKNDPMDFMLWLMEDSRFAKLPMTEYETDSSAWYTLVQEEAERREVERINRKPRKLTDLTDVMRAFDEDPESLRKLRR
jgi:hypothetical protein